MKGVTLNTTNRFHVGVSLFSNRSQMTSKCGKSKKVAHEAIAERAKFLRLRNSTTTTTTKTTTMSFIYMAIKESYSITKAF